MLLTTDSRNQAANAVGDRVDVGTTNAAGKLQIWTAALGTLLVEFDLENPAWGAASSGAKSLDLPAATTALAAGTPALALFLDRDETERYRMSASGSGGGGEVVLSESTTSVGQDVSIVSATLTMPAGSV